MLKAIIYKGLMLVCCRPLSWQADNFTAGLAQIAA